MRNKILSLFREIYSEIGNKMWNMIDISEKDQKFLVDNLLQKMKKKTKKRMNYLLMRNRKTLKKIREKMKKLLSQIKMK